MKFLADENVEPAIVHALELLGHDVLPVGPNLRAKSDRAVLNAARLREPDRPDERQGLRRTGVP